MRIIGGKVLQAEEMAGGKFLGWSKPGGACGPATRLMLLELKDQGRQQRKMGSEN